MTVTTSCKGCGLQFTAEDDERLADLLVDHIAQAHAHGHAPTREQVLAVIRSRRVREQA